jgi:hypothetical protein
MFSKATGQASTKPFISPESFIFEINLSRLLQTFISPESMKTHTKAANNSSYPIQTRNQIMNKPTRRVSLEDFFGDEKARLSLQSIYDDDSTDDCDTSTLLAVFQFSLKDRVTSLEMEIEQAAVVSEIQEANARHLEEENERLHDSLNEMLNKHGEVTRKLKELEEKHRDLKNMHLWLRKQSKNMKERVINQVINEIKDSKDVKEAPNSKSFFSAMAQKVMSIHDDLKNEKSVV